MRLTTVILLVSLLQVSASTFGQRITINQKNAALESVLKEIRKQSGYGYYYGNDVIPEKQKINIAVTNASLEEALSTALQGLELKFEIEDKVIVIKKKEPSFLDRIVDRFAAIDVRGRVVDGETGEGLPGATVKVKGLNKSVSTDKDGDFFLENVSEDALLEISYIGYLTKEVNAGRELGIIRLEMGTSDLEEVTVSTGYWSTSKKLSTGNIGKITSRDIGNQPVSNPIASLQGRISGLEVIQQSGVAGGNFQVRIRGTNSIANGNDPLYVIDGVPYISGTLSTAQESSSQKILVFGTSPLNSINPLDIESIEVLKDADATAIYGSRGSNGVILITTKRGNIGRVKVNVNLSSGIGKVTSKQQLLNTSEYLAMRNEAFKNDNVTPDNSNARDLLIWDKNRNTDWQKELLGGTANYTDFQGSISGGDTNTQFIAGGGYHKETTVFPGKNDDQRGSVHLSISNTSPNKKLKTFFSVIYSLNSSSLLNLDLTSKSLFLPPNAPALYTEEGDLNWDGWNSDGPYENPLAYLKRRYEANNSALIGNSTVSYSILPNVEVKTNVGYTNTILDAYNLTPLSSFSPSVVSNSVSTTHFSNSKFQNWIIEPQLNWKPKVGKNLFEFLIGGQLMSQKTEALTQKASGFSSEALMKNISSAPTREFGINTFAQYRYSAIFGRINYNFQNKYLVNITGRRDGSSRFGSGKQFANFGAIGVGWILTEEDFIKNTFPFLSFGKIRGSYGLTGNDQLTDYQYLDGYSSTPGPYQGVVGLRPTRLSNPIFAWEINKKAELAIELGFLNNRISTNFSYYRNRSSNQLVGQPLPPTTGFTSIQANLPATVQNTGFEVELNTKNILSRDFTWSSSLNFSVPKNKLISFPNLESSPTYANLYAVGKPLSIKKLYTYTGINPTSGFYQVEDVNGDGSFTQLDRRTFKFVGATIFGGLQNSFEFKGFQLDLFMQFVKQTGTNYLNYTVMPGLMFNQPSLVTGGDDLQKFTQASASNSTYGLVQSSDRTITDASYIRLKNLSLSWNLPKALVGKAKFENARIYALGQNLFTITDYSGLDPELQARVLPPLRVVTFGVNVTF